jgi:aryl-alcohol dehydrogenase-like predicted oxidoreductase
MELTLGTAKMGIKAYGFSSKAKRSPPDKLMQEAWEIGIKSLDTSPRYGNAEELIGAFHRKTDYKFKVSTKIDNLDLNKNNFKEVIFSSVERSLEKMQLNEIETLYLHQNDLKIISNPRILDVLRATKERYPVKKVGASIYSYEECRFAIEHDIYDVVQVPISILDSNIYSRVCDGLNNRTEIIARSVFLQGLIFNRNLISLKVKQFQKLTKYLNKLDSLAIKYRMDLVAIACGYVARLNSVSNFIVGSSSVDNLKILCKYSQEEIPEELFLDIYQMAKIYKVWGNPRNW